MSDVPFAFAFAAGLVATVNPCGFAMLPAYLSYFVGLEDGESEGTSTGADVGRGLVIGAVVSGGFLLVFGVSGALVSAGLRSVVDYIPWVALFVGILLVVLGVAMLFFGYEPRVRLPKLERGGANRSYGQIFLFGVSYAVASLSCALPVFLAVVAAATATSSFAAGVLTFVVYGAGMSMLLVALTVALAVGKGGLVRRLRGVLPYVGRVAGAILIVAGGYIAVFWAANLRDPLSARGATFQFVESIQNWLSNQLGSRPGFWAVVLGGLLALAALIAARARYRRDRDRERHARSIPSGPTTASGNDSSVAAPTRAGEEPGVRQVSSR